MDQPPGIWDHCLEHAAVSDVGLCRANNQDAMAVVLADGQKTFAKRGHLFVVADGMGAHAAGELASKLAADTLSLTYSKRTDLPPSEALLTATRDANAKIHSRGTADEEFRGMGTTCTALAVLEEGAVLAHVGDSRAYRLRGDRLEQLTFDHSLVWEMRAAGSLSEEEILEHVPKNIITRSLGPNPTVAVDLEGPFPIAPGDTFLLCSDGLSGPVEDKEMGAILASMPPQQAVRALVDLANLRGGPDNITVIVVRVAGPQSVETADASADAAKADERSTHRSVHPMVWVVLAVWAAIAAGAAVMDQWVAAAVCLIGALATGISALVYRHGGNQNKSRLEGQRLGKGPHRACRAAPNERVAAQFDRIVGELREAATLEQWKVDWDEFNAIATRAAAARDAGDHAGAIREHFQAVAFMMGQLKHQRDTRGK